MRARHYSLAAGLSGLLSLVASAETPQTVEPPEVFARVQLVRSRLEQIRYVMGRPENSQPELPVRNAAPREVYFLALTMFRKAERLCFEHTREHVAEPKLPRGPIRPSDVLAVVEATLECLQLVQDRLGIERSDRPVNPDPEKTPTDVLRSTIQANRQLNLLLEHQFAPSDVYEQVTLGIGYTARLLETFPEATTMGDPPPFEPGKRPGDVYRLLLKCFDRIRQVAETSGTAVLELEVAESQITGAEPSDVYDIASLLISELAFLHSRRLNAEPPRQVYYAGRKFPSHVYHRVGLLERQLVELQKWVDRHPDWLDARAPRK